MSDVFIRAADSDDLDGMLALSDARRRQYESYQPIFWRPASDAAEQQRPYLAALIADDSVICRVAVTDDRLAGFVVGRLLDAPPVYDPGGLTCSLDDFTVADSELWGSVGVDLLHEVQREAAGRGAVQLVVVCGHADAEKRAALDSCGLTIASEWWVTGLET